MSPYPPRFNLRHFMSHLAPGGHFVLQLFFPMLFLFWMIFPADVHAMGAKLGKLHGVAWTIGFVTLATIGYFVGVVLRLRPVDAIDDECIEGLLRRHLAARHTLGAAVRDWVSCWLTVSLPGRATALTVAEVRRRANRQPVGTASPAIEGVLDASGQLTAAEAEERFCDWLQRVSVRDLQEAWKAPVAMEDGFTPAPSWAGGWLWIVDRFPYPRFIAHRALFHSGATYRQQFVRDLWPVLQEMIAHHAAKLHPQHDFFNRCKSYVATYCPAAAGEVSEREALVRMMAGFYQGLSVGLRGALFVAFVAASGLAAHLVLGSIAPSLVRWHSAHGFSFFLTLALFLCAVNTWFWILVHNRFHFLRLSEAQAVFDSYLLAKDYRHHCEQVHHAAKDQA